MHKLAEEGESIFGPGQPLPARVCQEWQTHDYHSPDSVPPGFPAFPSDVPWTPCGTKQAIWQMLCEARPITVDGGKLAYHAITGGFVLGKVLEKVSGRASGLPG